MADVTVTAGAVLAVGPGIASRCFCAGTQGGSHGPALRLGLAAEGAGLPIAV